MFTYSKSTVEILEQGVKYNSCVNQLVFIAHEICKSFDEGHEVKGYFLDILKTFDKV